MAYLDYNADAPLKPAVRSAMAEALERVGNPSSTHRHGRTARRYVEEARAAVAALAGVEASGVTFTSGGTEANNLAAAALDIPLIISTIEHPSMAAAANGRIAAVLPTNGDGVIDLNEAGEVLKNTKSPALVSVMLANNETGAIQPVAELSRLAKSFGHFVHTDAVQAAGRLPLDFKALGADMMTLSAHKIGGPQGAGALAVAAGLNVSPVLVGGGQEMGRRAGTENVAAITGFGVAAQLAIDDLRDMPRLRWWRDALQRKLTAIGGEDAVVAAAKAERLGNTLCVAMRGVSGETQVMSMDLAGVEVSAGAACSSGKTRRSKVLAAMGYDDETSASAIRISLGWGTTADDLEKCVAAWQEVYSRACARSGKGKLRTAA